MYPLARSVGGGAVATDRSVIDILRAPARRTSSPGRSPPTVRKYRVRLDRHPTSGRAGTPANGPAQRAADDVDPLVDVLVGLAALGGGPDATLDVVLEDH